MSNYIYIYCKSLSYLPSTCADRIVTIKNKNFFLSDNLMIGLLNYSYLDNVSWRVSDFWSHIEGDEDIVVEQS